MLKEDFIKAIRLKHHSRKTEKAYWGWIARFINFYKTDKVKHPGISKENYIENFLSILANYCSYSTQNQAHLLFFNIIYSSFQPLKISGLSPNFLRLGF
jgi:hypothetical protein